MNSSSANWSALPAPLKARLLAKLRKIETPPPPGDPLAPFRADPSNLLRRAGYEPDPWQAAVLRDWSDRLLLLCSRQAGKSLTAAGLALRDALLRPPAFILLLSPTLRQSGELFREKLLRLYDRLGAPVPTVGRTQLSLELANGSRVVSLPETEEGIRGFSGVTLLVIDEAARLADPVYRAARPFLATTGGRLVALTTPFGRRGWFHEEWSDPSRPWRRVSAPVTACPRITAEFLEEERQSMGERWFSQEYHLEFLDPVGAVFSSEVIEAALRPGAGGVLFGG